MSAAPLPVDEAARLAALHRYGVLDTPSETDFDNLVQLAASICGAPIALITLVDENRQWFKAKLGVDVSESPRSVAFCAHALNEPGLFSVPDATKDMRFADNPLVTGEPHIRFYAGAPLVDPEGHALGTLCVIDSEPRRLTSYQEQALTVLARQAMSLLERSRLAQELASIHASSGLAEPPPGKANRLGRWLPWAFGIALLALIVVGMNAGRSLLSSTDLAQTRLQVRNLLLDGKDLSITHQAAAIAQRDFLLTGDERALLQQQDALNAADETLRRLVDLAGLPGMPPFDLLALQPLLAREQSRLDAALQTYRSEGPVAAQALLRAGSQDEDAAVVRATIDAQIARVVQLQDARVGESAEGSAAALAWLSAGGLASAAVLLTGFAWLRREVSLREQAVAALSRINRSIEKQVDDRTAAVLTTNAALRASEAFVRSIGDNLPEGMIYQLILDADGVPHFQYLSAGVERIHGMTATSIVNNSSAYYDQIFDEDRPVIAQARAAADRKGGRFSADVRIRRPDGEVRWIHLSSLRRPLPDGRLLIDGIELDITDRKNAEAALRTSDAQLHELLAQLRSAQEAERIRISRQIHDELGQLLTGLKMDLRWLERKLSEPGVPQWCNPLLDRTVAASEMTDQTIATVQKIAADLRPTALDHLGLAAALTQRAREFKAQSGINCSLQSIGPEPALPAPVASDLFYICQEALTNIARHASASEVSITLELRKNDLLLEIIDNGVGIDPAKINGRHSLGLLGMRERATQWGATLEVQRNHPRGTRVSVRASGSKLFAEESTT